MSVLKEFIFKKCEVEELEKLKILPNEILNKKYEIFKKECENFIKLYDKIGFNYLTKEKAKMDFLDFKYSRKKYPVSNSFVFNKHQFKMVGAEKGSMYDLIKNVSLGTEKSENLYKMLKGKISNSIFMSKAIMNYKMCPDFPPHIARKYMEKYCPKDGIILDPCHGFGGRLIGFLASDTGKEYFGIDVSPYQSEGVCEVYDTLKEFSQQKIFNSMRCDFLEAPIFREYDFAITSPPYFDTEKYLGGNQSYLNKKNYEEWKEQFYKPLIEKVCKSLKKGCYFCLNVGNRKYPLVFDGLNIALNCGFVLEKKEQIMVNNLEDEEKGEFMLILKKGEN